ncbi:MAG: winged helix-turn-helix domain-containing protein [Candidatus Methanofastidiosia archaeon]
MCVQPRFKLWLENKDGKFILGEGTCALLENIGATGSIAEAAKKCNISYAHAWKKIRNVEKQFGNSLVKRHRGGTGGGSSKLSDKGKELLNLYKKIEKKIEDVI